MKRLKTSKLDELEELEEQLELNGYDKRGHLQINKNILHVCKGHFFCYCCSVMCKQMTV